MKKTKIFMLVALSLILVVCLCACIPGNAEKAKAKMEKAGYEANVLDAKSLEDYGTGVDSGFYAINEKLDFISVIYFDSKADAKDFYEDMVAETEDADEEDGLLKIKGKAVYMGSEQAIEDFE